MCDDTTEAENESYLLDRREFGVTAGVVAAVRPNAWPDYLASSLALTGICLPTFVIGPLLVLAFALKGLPSRVRWDDLRRRAQSLESRLGLPFGRYVSRLRAMNRWSASELHLG